MFGGGVPFPLPGGETVTRLRAAVRIDSMGNPVEDWSVPTSAPVGPCAISTTPGQTADPFRVGRNPLDIDAVLYVSATTVDVAARDRIEMRGRTYNVDGEPFRWRSPFTGLDYGWVVCLTVREG